MDAVHFNRRKCLFLHVLVLRFRFVTSLFLFDSPSACYNHFIFVLEEISFHKNRGCYFKALPLFVAMFPLGDMNRRLGAFFAHRFPRQRATCGTRTRPPVAIAETESNPPLTLVLSKEGQYMLFTKEGSAEPVKHFLVANAGYSLRVCQYCKLKGEKFANGNTRQTYYKCDACGVHLCRPQIRDCFLNYHQLKFAEFS